MAKSKGGRPSSYKEQYCDGIVKAFASGEVKFVEEYASSIGVHMDTLHEWRNKHPEFSEAFKKARQAQLIHFQEMGYGLANGRIKGQVAAWCFMMKNMFGWRDSIEQTQTLNIKGIVFDSSDDEDEEKN